MNGRGIKMRVIVISDTHRDFFHLREIVEKHREEAALFLHLGDGEREMEDLLALYPDLPYKYVRGNCDLVSLAPIEDVASVGGVNIFMTHGHHYNVKYTMDDLLRAARERNCTIALYGHTHVKVTKYQDGIYIMNPGSPSEPRDGRASYGIIDIVPGGIMTFTVDL